ncbi:HAD-like domain-containing protein [Pelagophyceae sp. CCMP2097]|nr:HAD-like domain-containing protein [Pelagophyceae sp. CCMP2097]
MRVVSTMSLAFSGRVRPKIRGVVFDLDGTLIKPTLDLAEMYKRVGVANDEDILEKLETMNTEERLKADGIIDGLEAEGRATMALMPGAVDLVRWLRRHGIPTAVVTRNTQKTVDFFHAEVWPQSAFDPAVSRDSGVAAKPDRAAMDKIAQKWGMQTTELLMVGDSLANDVGFGKNAGSLTALLGAHEGENGPDFCVPHLGLLPRRLWELCDIPGPLGHDAKLLKKTPPEATSAAAKATTAAEVDAALDADAAQLDARDESTNTALIYAADAGRADVVRALLARGADASLKGFLGSTAVSRAARRGNVDVLKALLDAPSGLASIDEPNDKMQYPLHFAAFKLNPAATALLLERGASTWSLDRKGRTPAEDTSDEAIRDAILAART